MDWRAEMVKEKDVVVATLAEVKESAMRFPNMPVAEAIRMNRELRDNVAEVLQEMRGQ
jgi:hypothetical protein